MLGFLVADFDSALLHLSPKFSDHSALAFDENEKRPIQFGAIDVDPVPFLTVIITATQH